MRGVGLRLYDDALTVAEASTLARQAEARGYEAIWVPESAGREAFGQLAACALGTRRVRLATGIANVYTRSPALMAMSLATLDDLSGGRAVLGLGVGHREALEQGHGVAFRQAFGRVREYVTVIRAILRGARVPAAPICGVSHFELAFTPRRAAVPIYVAALGSRMCEVAGEIADGVLLNWATPTYVAYAVDRVRAGAARAGRDVGAVDIACYLRTAVSANSAATEEALARQLTNYIAMDVYRRMLDDGGFARETAQVLAALPGGVDAAARRVSDRLLTAVTVVGDDAARRARLEEYRRAGVTHPVMAPVAVGEDPLQSWIAAIDAFGPTEADPRS